ncbi:lytic transglycosylase domain-containing protein [Rummeliibacillus sp. JY-2-4R]
MYTQSLSQLPNLQGMNSVGTTSMTNSSTPTSGLFAQMLSQLTAPSSSTSQASQILGLTNSLSSPNSNVYLSQLLSSPSLINNSLGYGTSSPIDYSQLLGGLELSTTSDSQSVSSYSNPETLNNYAVNYSGLTPIFTPASLNTNSNFSLDELTTKKSDSNSESANTSYDSIIKKAAQTYGLPEKMIKSVIKQESNFNASATSSAGAGGLMQLMPGTANYLGVSNVYDAEQNIMGGTKYLKQLYDQFNGSFPLMLAAYNAGPGTVTKYAGVPPYKETMNYVTNIMNTYNS